MHRERGRSRWSQGKGQDVVQSIDQCVQENLIPRAARQRAVEIKAEARALARLVGVTLEKRVEPRRIAVDRQGLDVVSSAEATPSPASTAPATDTVKLADQRAAS